MTKREKESKLRRIVTTAIRHALELGINFPADIAFHVVDDIMQQFDVKRKST